MENLSNLLSFSFWFDLRPPALLPVFNKIFIILIIFLLVLSVVFWYLKKEKKGGARNILENYYYFFVVNTLFGVIFYFLNYELIPFLSSRFWFLLWGLEMVVWIYFIYKMKNTLSEKREQGVEEKEYKKYIP